MRPMGSQSFSQSGSVCHFSSGQQTVLNICTVQGKVRRPMIYPANRFVEYSNICSRVHLDTSIPQALGCPNSSCHDPFTHFTFLYYQLSRNNNMSVMPSIGPFRRLSRDASIKIRHRPSRFSMAVTNLT